MLKRTKKWVIYIIFFFGLISFILAGYFIYQFYFEDTMEIDNTTKIKLFDIEREKKVIEKTGHKKVILSGCNYNGKIVNHLERRIFYKKEFVGMHQNCIDFSEMQICDNGTWIGKRYYKFTSCKQTSDCILETGKKIKNNESIKMYSKKLVPFNKNCQKYASERRCENSILLGDEKYKYLECKVDMRGICEIGDIFLENKEYRIFYSIEKLPYNKKCKDYSFKRMCQNGILDGDEKYKFSKCIEEKPRNCFTKAGVKILHNEEKFLYSSLKSIRGFSCKYFKKKRKCYNGILDGDKEYKFETCY